MGKTDNSNSIGSIFSVAMTPRDDKKSNDANNSALSLFSVPFTPRGRDSTNASANKKTDNAVSSLFAVPYTPRDGTNANNKDDVSSFWSVPVAPAAENNNKCNTISQKSFKKNQDD